MFYDFFISTRNLPLFLSYVCIFFRGREKQKCSILVYWLTFATVLLKIDNSWKKKPRFWKKSTNCARAHNSWKVTHNIVSEIAVRRLAVPVIPSWPVTHFSGKALDNSRESRLVTLVGTVGDLVYFFIRHFHRFRSFDSRFCAPAARKFANSNSISCFL